VGWLDWIVLGAALAGVVLYGLWQSRRKNDMQSYVLANHALPWWVVFISVAATQASATTFLSIPGKAFDDGLKFVQFYFGLPLASVVLAITAIPIYHKLGVLTAYEYLEGRFDAKTRALVAVLFLLQRGLATGLTIYTPALVLAVLLQWPIWISTLLIGSLAILYTVAGGSAAVARTQTLQAVVIWGGMATAVIVMIWMLPAGVGVGGAIDLAAVHHKTTWLVTTFDWESQFNIWSGLIGGFFLQMAYFGTDQSQVSRYLSGRSVKESRVGLLAHGLTKIPLQFAILFIGIFVFAVYQFQPQPAHFNPIAVEAVRQSPRAAEFAAAEADFQRAWEERRDASESYVRSAGRGSGGETVRSAQANLESARKRMSAIVRDVVPRSDGGDADFVFLRFVVDHLPSGLVGLVLAAIFFASMGACSAQLAALGSASTVDLYRRFLARPGSEQRDVTATRIFTFLWGTAAIGFAQFAGKLGSLVVAVNEIGSLFYGTMLGIFLVAFYVKRVGGTAVCTAALLSEAIVFAVRFGTPISFLWYNVIGCVAVVVLSVLIETVWLRRVPEAAVK
jgi:SSS family transporter